MNSRSSQVSTTPPATPVSAYASQATSQAGNRPMKLSATPMMMAPKNVCHR